MARVIPPKYPRLKYGGVVRVDTGLLKVFLDAAHQSVPTFCTGDPKVTFANCFEEGFKANIRKLPEKLVGKLSAVVFRPFRFHNSDKK